MPNPRSPAPSQDAGLIPRERLRCLAGRLHSLGPRPLFEFLREIEAGAPVIDRLERYSELWPLRNFIREMDGAMSGDGATIIPFPASETPSMEQVVCMLRAIAAAIALAGERYDEPVLLRDAARIVDLLEHGLLADEIDLAGPPGEFDSEVPW